MTRDLLLPTAEPVLRRFWYPVVFATECTAGPVAVRLLGVELVVWSPVPGEVVAAVDRCPHRDARLSPGKVVGGALQCPYHGWEYGSDGRAVHLPQLDAGVPVPPKACLTTFPTTVRYGLVWVCLEPPALGGIPHLPEYGAVGWRVVEEPPLEFGCPAPVLLDNNIDPAHIAFVHQATFGTPERPEVVEPRIEATPSGLVVHTRVPVTARPGEQGATERLTTAELHLPFVGLFRIVYPDGLHHLMLKCCTPMDDTTTRQLQVVLRNDTEADRPAAEIVAFDRRVGEEDRVVLESIVAGYHLDLTANVHLRSDRASVELRRRYARLLAEHDEPDAAR